MSFWLQALLNLFEHGSTLKKVEVRQQPQIFILEMIDFVVFELLAFESSGGRENNKSDFKTPSLWKPTSPAVWVSWSLLVLQFLIWVLMVIKVWGGVRQGWGWPGGWQDCQMTSVSFWIPEGSWNEEAITLLFCETKRLLGFQTGYVFLFFFRQQSSNNNRLLFKVEEFKNTWSGFRMTKSWDRKLQPFGVHIWLWSDSGDSETF